ncbi:hypothetical protein ACLBXM_17840 [Xanthobacteraceae bacterium A53D]
MSTLASWKALDANPITPDDCRVRAQILRSEAAGLPVSNFDRIERLTRAADRFEATARRLEHCRAYAGDEAAA